MRSPYNRPNRHNRSSQPSQYNQPSQSNRPARGAAAVSHASIPIPYTFRPVATQAAVLDTPVWRDGSAATGSEPLLSGELLITLEALTPLIVGNHQHRIDENHSKIAPQMLDDGRVLIPGSSLKGMVRAALADLLNAPMERVAEHHYTYRPNLGFVTANPRREQRAAVVLNPTLASGGVEVALLDPKEVTYVPEAIWRALGSPAPGTRLKRPCAGLMFENDQKSKYRKKIITAKSSDGTQDRTARIELSHTVLRYVGGIDGEGLLATAHEERKKQSERSSQAAKQQKKQIYHHVFYPTDKLDAALRQRTTIPPALVRQYEETQRILADDRIGHFAPGHPLSGQINKQAVQNAILNHQKLTQWQLIYVEYDPAAKKITSLGHHFHYRWAYTSSVRCKNRLLDGQGELRPELALHPQEQAAESGAPQQLTGARLLFGYAVDGRNPDQQRLAKGSFKRLAGRIAFNTAIECPEDKTPEQRFIDGGAAVQLRILGTPRPSAVEFYLKQTALPRKLITYGDLLDDSGGDLAGRKHYRHQPDAKNQKTCYAPSEAEKQHDDKTKERGNLVHYLSAPGSRFRCTLRFQHLRPWELGALLAALEPARLEPLWGLATHPLGYAHKLGYGKPLGLGSIKLTIDAARWQENERWSWQQARSNEPLWNELAARCLTAFKAKLDAHMREKAQEHVKGWLEIRRWQAHGRADYPTSPDKEGKPTIFSFHTDLRRRHAQARRGQNGDFSDLQALLKLSGS